MARKLVSQRVTKHLVEGIQALIALTDTTPAGSRADFMAPAACPLIARSFGVATFATILGSVVLVETATQIASPTLAGIIFDSTGSYDLALVMFALAFLTAAVLFPASARFRLPLNQYVPGSTSSR